jgi:hypothetical protein
MEFENLFKGNVFRFRAGMGVVLLKNLDTT